jgi:exonuclease III
MPLGGWQDMGKKGGSPWSEKGKGGFSPFGGQEGYSDGQSFDDYNGAISGGRYNEFHVSEFMRANPQMRGPGPQMDPHFPSPGDQLQGSFVDVQKHARVDGHAMWNEAAHDDFHDYVAEDTWEVVEPDGAFPVDADAPDTVFAAMREYGSDEALKPAPTSLDIINADVPDLVEYAMWASHSGDFNCAKQVNLQLRERWAAQRETFQARGLTFVEFNMPFQKAFRAWRDIADKRSTAVVRKLPERHWIHQPDLVPDGRPGERLRVMTWNILSDHLSDLFSYQFVMLSEHDGDFLHWNIRQEMIIDVIKDAEPDVACFQEVDFLHFDALSAALWQRVGLKALPLAPRKPNSRDGVCIFYKPARLTMVNDALCATMPEHPAIAQALFRLGSLPVLVSCAYVPGNYPSCSTASAKALFDCEVALDGPASAAGALADGEAFAHIVAGDLNGLMDGVRGEVLSRGYESAYPADTVTAHNDTYHWCGELDYIWAGSGAEKKSGKATTPPPKVLLQRILAPQSHERLTSVRSKEHPQTSMPSANWPSDHVSLVADFVLTTD